MPAQRLWALDGLRGLAAIAVVAYHYLYRAGELFPNELGEPQRWIQWGSYGVQLFFLISGFVVFESARRSTSSRFFFNRAVRIYPAYWTCAALVFAVISFWGLEGRDSVSPSQVALNFTLLQGFFDVDNIDGAWWTLTVELAFYLQIGLLARFGLLSDRRLPLTLFSWLFITLAIRFAVVASGIDSIRHLSGILYWIPCFLIGIGLNLALSGRILVGTSLSVVSLLSMLPGNFEILFPLMIATGLMTLAAMMRLPKKLEHTAEFLGEISYPLYLLHQNIGYILLLALAAVGMNREASALVVFVIALTLATAIAYIVDRPLRRRLRDVYSHHSAKTFSGARKASKSV